MLESLFDNNKNWADKLSQEAPDYFPKLSQGQSPEYLWIGCADSRVPAESLMGLSGEIFVHRNIANQVKLDDDNTMSVVQYAVEVLKVKHIIVCGHTGCGGVKAALMQQGDKQVASWLTPLKNYAANSQHLSEIENEQEKTAWLEIANVKKQVEVLVQHSVVKAAWEQQQPLTIHGWLFQLEFGLLKDLDVNQSA